MLPCTRTHPNEMHQEEPVRCLARHFTTKEPDWNSKFSSHVPAITAKIRISSQLTDETHFSKIGLAVFQGNRFGSHLANS